MKLSKLGALVSLYFLLPKLDLFGIPGIPTGIRVQDFVTLGILLSPPAYSFIRKFLLNPRLVVVVSAVLSINFLGAILFDTIPNFFLGWMRIGQYFVVGAGLAALIADNDRYISRLVWFVIFVGVLQYFLLVPVVDPGRGVFRTPEYAGTFGTAAEFSYFIAVVVFLMAATSKNRIFGLLASLAPVFNGVRAYYLSPLLYLFFEVLSKRLRVFWFFPFIAFAFSIFVFYSDFLREFFNVVAASIGEARPELSQLNSGSAVTIGDLSLLHRVGKWSTSFSILLNTPAFWIGTGLYSAGGALDGGLLRLALELGLPFFVFFLLYLHKLGVKVLAVFVATNLFFDGYLSSVVMPVFFALMIVRKNATNG